jgi:hypothetical protein
VPARAFIGCTILGLLGVGVCCAASAQTAGATTPSAAPQTPILGFSPAHAIAERGLEAQFQSLPSADRAREWHRLFSAEPHPAASARNNELAAVIARSWRQQGWEQVTLRTRGGKDRPRTNW